MAFQIRVTAVLRSVNFFTGAPCFKSRSSSLTQNVAGVIAESKMTTPEGAPISNCTM